MEIEVLRNVLEANDAVAAENRRLLKERGIHALNLIASPGAGKTSLLERTLDALGREIRIAVVEGDIAGSADAERIARRGVPVVQINTGGDCHLNAAAVRSALGSLPLEGIRLLFIENVGNLVCPAGFDLGEDAKVVILSVAEGDDKPAKYPLIFERSSAMVLNKIDLLGMVDFDLERAKAAARALHPDLPIFELSARTGEGMAGWLGWLTGQFYTEDRPVSQRAQALAKVFRKANEELIALVEPLSDARWREFCAPEGRTVGVVVYHVAEGHALTSEVVRAVATEQPLPFGLVTSREEADRKNTRQAEQHADCTREETLESLRRNGAVAAGLLLGLSDRQLELTRLVWGRERSAAQLIDGIMIGHLQGHLASLCAWIEREA